VEFLLRKKALDTWSREARRHFEGVDVIAVPTTAASAPALAALATWDRYRPANLKMARNTSIANLLQLNALTLPGLLPTPYPGAAMRMSAAILSGRLAAGL
jgi:Asp-tRNA(Asn)/Glu-tRNA(Gln) amidotransferase A subunit family amidase